MAMIVIMALPILGLTFFFFLPFWQALPAYLCCLILSALMYYGMFSVMGKRRKVQSGFEKFINEEAVVVEDLNPEGTVEIDDEIWKATAKGHAARKGEKVKITGHDGIRLVVENAAEEENTQSRGGSQ